jgi:hypothetical protein
MDGWNGLAERAVCALAATGSQFTVDDVWASLPEGEVPENSKALGGVMTVLSKRGGVIAAVPAWTTSVRKTDRPIRYWVGTGKPHSTIDPTEDEVVKALEAIQKVAHERSQTLAAAVRAART